MNEELFHASQDSEIEVLEPRAITVRDKREGPVVFATEDKAYSTMFLVPSDDTWTIKGGYRLKEDERLWITIIGDEKRFRETDKGGAIYTLPKNNFVTDPNYGTSEWISKTSVIPLSKEVFSSGLDAMIQNRVIVYFTSPEKFQEIKKSSPNPIERFPLLKELISENEKRGLENPIKLKKVLL